jgi:hypothetical protein
MTNLKKINQILAADHDLSKIDPANDQIWEFSTETGEPPALALGSTYGLRAFSMRVFPRFQNGRISVTDPNAFFEYPAVFYSAPNFIHIHFSPFNFIDVNLRVWVPTSQVVVGQVTLDLKTDQPDVMTMEWVAMLSPFPGGTIMTAMDYSINTILAGKSRNLEPVFLLTGAPRSGLSSNPGLGLTISLRPGLPRQFTWVLASLENREISFYAARKYSASLLEAEQLKIEMTRKKRSLTIETNNGNVDSIIRKSQNRMEQLVLPPFGKFQHATFVQSRLVDHGYSNSHDASDSGPNWGIQTSTDTWLASRILLPTHPEFMRGILQNFLDQQTANGTIDMLTSWAGKRTGILCTPLLASLAVELHQYLQDEEWLGLVFPALLRNLQAWFQEEPYENETGFPRWEHPLQLGFPAESTYEGVETQDWSTFVRTAESPALAALLYRECECLLKMAVILGHTDDVAWVEEKAAQLKTLVIDCWNEKNSRFQNRDMLNHTSLKPGKAISYRRNGSFPIRDKKSSPSFTIFKVHLVNGIVHPLIIEVMFKKGKKATLTDKEFEWSGNYGVVLLDRSLENISAIKISGLARGESVKIYEPDFTSFDPTLIIPLWTGIASPEQAASFFMHHLEEIEHAGESKGRMPSYLRVILMESLIRYKMENQAARLFHDWYVDNRAEREQGEAYATRNSINKEYNQLDDLIPIHTLLTLSGISRWAPHEITIENINQNLGPITVQYGQTVLDLSRDTCVIKHENGETSTITQAGKYKIFPA